MHELVSKVEGGCMSACFHMAPAAESYRMAVGLGQAKVGPALGLFLKGGFDQFL